MSRVDPWVLGSWFQYVSTEYVDDDTAAKLSQMDMSESIDRVYVVDHIIAPEFDMLNETSQRSTLKVLPLIDQLSDSQIIAVAVGSSSALKGDAAKFRLLFHELSNRLSPAK